MVSLYIEVRLHGAWHGMAGGWVALLVRNSMNLIPLAFQFPVGLLRSLETIVDMCSRLSTTSKLAPIFVHCSTSHTRKLRMSRRSIMLSFLLTSGQVLGKLQPSHCPCFLFRQSAVGFCHHCQTIIRICQATKPSKRQITPPTNGTGPHARLV